MNPLLFGMGNILGGLSSLPYIFNMEDDVPKFEVLRFHETGKTVKAKLAEKITALEKMVAFETERKTKYDADVAAYRKWHEDYESATQVARHNMNLRKPTEPKLEPARFSADEKARLECLLRLIDDGYVVTLSLTEAQYLGF